MDPGTPSPDPALKNTLCKYWASASCHFGDRCWYAHPVLRPGETFPVAMTSPADVSQSSHEDCGDPSAACASCVQQQSEHDCLALEVSDLASHKQRLEAENQYLRKRLLGAKTNSQAWEHRYTDCLASKMALEDENDAAEAQLGPLC